MVLASLAANGTSIIKGLDHLDRGYENLSQKLNKIGACISRNQIQAQEDKQYFCSETDVA